jgi:hypothetical protein
MSAERRLAATRVAHARRLVLALAGCTILLAGAATRARAQVMQVEGGGSTLYSGVGGALNLWTSRVEGGVGLGWLDGFRFGWFARTALAPRDTLRLGNDAIPVRFPTDVFGGTNALLVEGASVTRTTARTHARVFGGAFATPLASPSFFTAADAEQAMALVQIDHALRPDLALTTHVVASRTQTVLQGVAWRRDERLTLGATAGVGANDPYGAASLHWRSPRLEVRASYIEQGDEFRRVGVPSPIQAEADRENLIATWRARPGVVLGAGRQHFRQDSVLPGTAATASLNQVFANARWGATNVNGGLLDAASGGTRTLSAYVDASRDVTSWLQAQLYLLHVRPDVGEATTTPVLFLREFVTPRLMLLQVLSRIDDRTTVSLGGSFTAGLVALGVDYQVIHTPFRPKTPFTQALSLTARLQLGNYQVNGSSFVSPDGRVNYTASGSTYVYLDGAAGPSRSAGTTRMGRHMLRGRGVDELVFTDSRGEFFVRRTSAREARVAVALDEFLAIGRFEVVRAPATATPEPEARARALEIVLRRLP